MSVLAQPRKDFYPRKLRRGRVVLYPVAFDFKVRERNEIS